VLTLPRPAKTLEKILAAYEKKTLSQ